MLQDIAHDLKGMADSYTLPIRHCEAIKMVQNTKSVPVPDCLP